MKYRIVQVTQRIIQVKLESALASALERWREGEIEAMRLLASKRVRSRRSKGMLPRTRMELSVKSMQSWVSW